MQEPTAATSEAAAHGGGLDTAEIIDKSGILIYIALGILATWGVYNIIMLYRTLGKKSLPQKDADTLIDQVRTKILSNSDAKGAVEVCQEPSHWHSALAQLMAVAIRNRNKGLAKIKQLLVMDFHTEVISGLENRLASISTAARMGPLLGLLGTVMAMIAAFGRMGANAKPDPMSLANSISLGLIATAAGLLIANPLMILGNDVAGKLRRLRDRTERQLSDFLEILEQDVAQRSQRAQGRSSSRA